MKKIIRLIQSALFKNKARCDHEFHLYNIGTYVPPFCTNEYARYQFACKHCGIEHDVDSMALQSEIKEEKSQYKKQIMMEKIIDENNDSELCFKTFPNSIPTCCRGGHVERIKNKYLDRGINLDEITEATRKL